MAQKLSPKAAKDKSTRDLAAANTPGREKKRAECQKKEEQRLKSMAPTGLLVKTTIILKKDS